MTDKREPKAGQVVEEERIPLVEERVRVDRRVIPGRSVSISTHPETETVRVEEPVTNERITVERVAVNRVVDSVPDVREEGEVTILPVVEERLVVTTELVLREEVHIRRTRETTTQAQDVELVKTRVEIDEEPSGTR